MNSERLWVHSDCNRNLGIFLMFLGAMLVYPVLSLLRLAQAQSMIGNLPDGVEKGLWIMGAVLGFCGFAMLHLSRKRFQAEEGKIVVKDGILSRPLTFHWQGPASIQLSAYEDEHGEWWVIELISGKPHYCIHRSRGPAAETRNLAVALARAIRGPLVERDDRGDVIIPPQELGLPFPERLRLHPQLLLPTQAAPPGCPVQLKEDERSLTFSWKLTPGQILPYFAALLLFIAMMADAPLFPGPLPVNYANWKGGNLQRTALERAGLEGNYDYFVLCGAFLALTTGLALGYRKRLKASSQGVSCRSEIWGIPVHQASLPLSEFRDLWVRSIRTGASVQILSEHRALGGRISDVAVAHWIASRIAHFYAGQATPR